MNLNYDSPKTLILEMKTEKHELKDKIMINQIDLIRLLQHKIYKNDNAIYFELK